MNQPGLSRIPLQTLQAVYQQQAAYNPALALEDSLAALGDQRLAALLANDIERFQVKGLSSLSESEKKDKARLYGSISHPVADEVVDWLKGGYQFDPDCLTE